MSLASTVLWFKKVWAWCKKYWQLLVGIAIPIVAWIVTRRSPDLGKVIERVRADHKKEVDVLNTAHNLEMFRRGEGRQRYETTLAHVERRYSEEKIALDHKKKEEMKKLLKEHADDPDADPDEITRKLAELTGFHVHVD
jgi:hypothetical protein